MNKFRDNRSMYIAITVVTILAFIAYQCALNIHDEYGIANQVAYYIKGVLFAEFFAVLPLYLGILMFQYIANHANFQAWLKLVLGLAEAGILAIVLSMTITKIVSYMVDPAAKVALNMVGPSVIFFVTEPIVIGIIHLYDYILPKM